MREFIYLFLCVSEFVALCFGVCVRERVERVCVEMKCNRERQKVCLCKREKENDKA